ncbi:MAG: PAS domain-containing protein, partial [Nannocystaceae bacterium]|nr:PAS domain-containing protein [Nannocystaceae bacterium]
MTDGQHAGDLDENLRAIVVHSPLPMAILDRGLRYLLYSKRYLSAYHLEQEDLIGLHHYDVFPELPQRYRDVHQRCLAGATESGREEPFVRMDGRTEWTNWDARPWRLAS